MEGMEGIGSKVNLAGIAIAATDAGVVFTPAIVRIEDGEGSPN